jgi:hypothetical protein
MKEKAANKNEKMNLNNPQKNQKKVQSQKRRKRKKN